MDTTYEPLREVFSTADAERPTIALNRDSLSVNFRDWREEMVRLLFHDAIAFSWDDGEAALDLSHRDDCSYIVKQSAWLKRHRDVGTIGEGEEMHHYKLCFNAEGVLQVLAARIEVLT